MTQTLISQFAPYKTITLCGSMAHIDKMETIAAILTKEWKKILLPQRLEQQLNYDELRKDQQHTLLAESKNNLMHAHFNKINSSDAVLICNEEKKWIPWYIGANTLIEIAYAYFLKKPIFILNPYYTTSSRDEIAGMKPVVIHK